MALLAFAKSLLTLLLLASSASSSSLTSSFFLCIDDFLSYDEFIPELNSKALLYPNHLYFLLPRSMLQNRLTSSDMAALAVKASVALLNESKKNGHRSKRVRISPVLAQSEKYVDNGKNIEGDNVMAKSFQTTEQHGGDFKIEFGEETAKVYLKTSKTGQFQPHPSFPH